MSDVYDLPGITNALGDLSTAPQPGPAPVARRAPVPVPPVTAPQIQWVPLDAATARRLAHQALEPLADLLTENEIRRQRHNLTRPPRPDHWYANPDPHLGRHRDVEKSLTAALTSTDPGTHIDANPTTDPGRAILGTFHRTWPHLNVDAHTLLVIATWAGCFRPGRSHHIDHELLESVHHRHHHGLLWADTVLTSLGVDTSDVLWSMQSAWQPLAATWPTDHVSPWVAHRLTDLLGPLRPPVSDPDATGHWFRLLGTLPRLPDDVADACYPLALGRHKTPRGPAQQLLADHPDRTSRSVDALTHRHPEQRAAAATWLASHPDGADGADGAVVAALTAQLDTETDPLARTALIDALINLDHTPTTHLIPAAWAQAAVGTRTPPSLDWVPWNQLPTPTWATTGEPVPANVVRHLATLAVKHTPGTPTPTLCAATAAWTTTSRTRFADTLLTAWVDADLRPLPGDPDAHPVGSQTRTKGILALAAAAGITAAGTAVIDRYLRDHGGKRGAQSKTLLAVLAWSADPTATQLLLTTAHHHRTASPRTEATRLADQVADRRGWTADELADRAVPTAGLDHGGTLPLPYTSTRVFTGHLATHPTQLLTLEVRNPDGTTRKSLPPPRRDDDPDRVTATKTALREARTVVKTVATQQRRRLYDALCTQRAWPGTEWDHHVRHHPILGELAALLLWTMHTPAGPLTVPVGPDRQLRTIDGTVVSVPTDGTVTLTHGSLLPPTDRDRWASTWAPPATLFDQLHRPAPPQPSPGADRLEHVRGHMISSMTLRGQLTRRGWLRGPVEDGGVFTSYLKHYPSVGLTTVVEFTGASVPEDDVPAALTGVSFHPHPETQPTRRVPLREVPEVLLTETWHETAAVAAAGTGYTRGWRRKARF